MEEAPASFSKRTEEIHDETVPSLEIARQSLQHPLATQADLVAVLDTAETLLQPSSESPADEQFRAGYGVALLNRLAHAKREDRDADLPSERKLQPGEFVSYGFFGVKGADPLINIRKRLAEHSAVNDLRLEPEVDQQLKESLEVISNVLLAPERSLSLHALTKIQDNEIRSNLVNAGALRLMPEKGELKPVEEHTTFAEALAKPVSASDAFIVDFVHATDEASTIAGAAPLSFRKMVDLVISPAGMMRDKLYLRAPAYAERLTKALKSCTDKETYIDEMTQEMLKANLDGAFFDKGLPFSAPIVNHLLERQMAAVLVKNAPKVIAEAGISGEELFARSFTPGADKESLKNALANLGQRGYVLSSKQAITLFENGYVDLFFERDEYTEIFSKLLPFTERRALFQILPTAPTAMEGLATFVAERSVNTTKELSIPKELAYQLIDAGYVAEALNGQRAKLFESACKRVVLMERLLEVPPERIIAALPKLDRVNLSTDVAEKCIESGRVADVAKHIDKFFRLSPQVYDAFQQNALEGRAIDHLGRFSGLGPEVADRLKAAGKTRELIHAERAFTDLSPEVRAHLDRYKVLLDRIENSPSKTIRQMKDGLTEQLLATAEPEKTYEKIERIFLRNHIPLAAKVFLVFDTVYGDTRYKEAYSPTIKEASPRESRMLIYKDLINIHLDTGNPSLRTYLQDLIRVMPLVERTKQGGEAALSVPERALLEEFLRKLTVLRDVSHYGKTHPQETTTQEEGLHGGITAFEQSLGVKEGQSVQNRLEEMFLVPAGVATVEEALARMDASAKRADTINRALVGQEGQRLQLKAGDLLKRVDSKFFRSYQQNGNVTKECLGGDVHADATALDTDTGKVLEKDLAEGNKSALKESPSRSEIYGDITLVLRPEAERFLETKVGEDTRFHDQLRGKTAPYELFQTPVTDKERHFGIRTGVPFTEVRWIIMHTPGRRELLDLKMDIVAYGYYVPITDDDGEVLFSAKEFDQLRELYSGTELLPNTVAHLDMRVENAKDAERLGALEQQIVEERPLIERTRDHIEASVKAALAKAGIMLRTSGELAIGAEVLNTGSTARGTNIPGEVVDFDIVVRLDENDLKKQEEIQVVLDKMLQGQKQQGGDSQWRRTGIAIEGTTVDIDVTFTSKPEVEGVPSHSIAAQRLGSLERESQADADFVRANIVQAKLALKKAGIYKKADGGLGGLGVENWILQSGGSFARARKELLAQAIDERGEVRPFDDCAQRYLIPDPGINLVENLDQDGASDRKNYRHDNFFYFLNRKETDGYQKFVKALQDLG